MAIENTITKEKELKKISKIHFLVHPGFLSDPVTKDSGETLEDLKKYHKLLDMYLEQAKKLKDDELMIALTHTDKSEYKEGLEEQSIRFTKLQDLKKILGKRFIVLSSDFDVFWDEEAMKTIKDLAKQRGYFFDENVLSEAYGETLGVCVDNVAQNMNETGGFKNKTIIRPELTDASLYEGYLKSKSIENTKIISKKEHDRIDF